MTDWFGWFRKTLPLQLTAPLTVGPARQPEAAARMADHFVQKMAASEAGLPSDRIKNFRDYFPGDNIQQIAWKISAHADSLIVHDDEHESQTAWTLLLIISPSLSVEAGLSLFASLMDTGIFSGVAFCWISGSRVFFVANKMLCLQGLNLRAVPISNGCMTYPPRVTNAPT